MAKSAKSDENFQKISDLSRIVAKYPVIPYPVHRGEYRESQVAKVTKKGKKWQRSAKTDIQDLARIVAKYPGIPYPVHRSKYREYRESQVAKWQKVQKMSKSAKSSKKFQKIVTGLVLQHDDAVSWGVFVEELNHFYWVQKHSVNRNFFDISTSQTSKSD